MNKPISVCIIVKNAQKTLKECLESVRDFDEIILLDNGSTDKTLQIAQEFNATYKNLRIEQSAFIGFGALKNLCYAVIENIPELAASFHISGDYLRHLFKEETGEKITAFITNVKIEKSKAFLRTGQYRISEVAALTEQNAHPPVIVAKANGFADPSFIPATPGISNGIASVVEFSADFPKGKEINDKFKAKYGVDMNGHSAESFTAIWILKTAFEQAGSTDGTKVRDALAKMHIVGQFPNGPKIILPYNEIQFGDEVIDGVKHHHNNIPATVAIAQIQNGEWATVWPFEEAAADVQYPAPLK